ncbi:hypothetical protein PFISCL1PPCAC_9818, partial [Pristionchus fissidentatus]
LNRTLGENELFKQDLADVTREVLQQQLAERIEFATLGYSLQDSMIMRKGCTDIAKIFDLLDKNEVRHLSDWLLMARSAAVRASEADSFERQARNLLTLFSPTGEEDYGQKQWGGLIKKFYSKRWSLFCEYIQTGARFSQIKMNEKSISEVEVPFGHL